jgi:photosystem II stability/assembly factor-like uncharacterized protein
MRKASLVSIVAMMISLLIVGCSGQSDKRPPQAPVTTPTNPPSDSKSPRPVMIRWVQMINSTTGWGGTDQSILRTINGGINWTDVTPMGASTTENRISAKHFFSNQVGWVAVSNMNAPPAVWRTSDGGKTWTKVLLDSEPGTDASFVHFTDADHGWIMARGSGAAGSEAVDVHQTTDGGTRWTKISSTPSSPDTTGTLAWNGNKTGISFRDNLTGWVTGRGHQHPDRPASAWLYRTDDGGRSWKPQSLSIPKGFQSAQAVITKPPVFFGSEGVLPVVLFNVESQKWDAAFYQTRDGGDTWSFTTAVRYSSPDFVYQFLDAKHGWVTDGQQLSVTSDGGQRWTTVSPNISIKGTSELDFVTNETGWAIIVDPTNGDHVQLLKTTDGGHTWMITPASSN